MIEFKAIATGSKGNAYVVSDGESSILIECGVGFKTIQRAMNFQTSSLVGCLITHSHKDHCKGLKTVVQRGINVFMTKEEHEATGVQSYRIKHIQPRKQFKLNGWTILPFETEHDTGNPVGFLIQNQLGERLLFVTDSYYVRYQFKNINILAIECNWDEQTLNEKVAKGNLHPALKKRIMRSHMGLETLLDFFKANDLSKVQEIWLLHLSDGNSNEERIRNEVAKVTGKMIYIP